MTATQTARKISAQTLAMIVASAVVAIQAGSLAVAVANAPLFIAFELLTAIKDYALAGVASEQSKRLRSIAIDSVLFVILTTVSVFISVELTVSNIFIFPILWGVQIVALIAEYYID